MLFNRIADISNLSGTISIASDRKQVCKYQNYAFFANFLPLWAHRGEERVQEECEKRKVCRSKATNKTQITFSKPSKNRFKQYQSKSG